MKNVRFIFPILVLVLFTALLSCANAPDAGGDGGDTASSRLNVSDELDFEIPKDVEDVLLTYEKAIRTRDHDLFREVVWDDVDFHFYDETGARTLIGGVDALAEFQLEFMHEVLPREDYRISMINHGSRDENHVFVEFRHEIDGHRFWEGAGVQERNGRLTIVHGYVELPTPGPVVTNSVQWLADSNASGFLEDEEGGSLHEMVVRFFSGPHPVDNPFDEFFDGDGDGLISIGEIAGAEDYLLPGWHFYFSFANWRLEFLGDDYEEAPPMDELREILAAMTAEDAPEEEKRRYAGEFSRIQFPDAVCDGAPREVETLLDELADGNGDGILDEDELDIMIDAFTSVPRHENEADNYFRRAIDRERDGWVDWHDVSLILQASAMGWGTGIGGAEPPYEVRTNPDTLLDVQDDGIVDALEIETAVRAFSGDPDAVESLKESLRLAFDADGDGRVEAWEVEEVKAWLFYPRPANPAEPLDRETDVNEDGFLDPEELGITAGITSKGDAPPFEERIDSFLRRREAAASDRGSAPSGSAPSPAGSEFYRKLGTIQDRKLAVVSLDVGTERVDQETARGIVMFVENAFVNVGKVKVVDRANIEKVFEEVAFQSTGAIDETTAVEIGKLSGADIIVIGSINRVGGLFYLNTKLIAVETAEIIGSSIAQAEDPTGFLEMANQAVYKLF